MSFCDIMFIYDVIVCCSLWKNVVDNFLHALVKENKVHAALILLQGPNVKGQIEPRGLTFDYRADVANGNTSHFGGKCLYDLLSDSVYIAHKTSDRDKQVSVTSNKQGLRVKKPNTVNQDKHRRRKRGENRTMKLLWAEKMARTKMEAK